MSTKMQDVMTQLRSELRYEPIECRVRADAVVDSTRAILVWEPRRAVPSYAVPEEDIAAELRPSAAAEVAELPGVLHPGIPFSVHTAEGEPVSVGAREGAGFRLADPAGFVVLDFGAFGAWYEEDERVVGHPREPFHRVDVRRSSRALRIELDGEPIAATTRARMVFETSLPTRFYIPREDLRVALRPSDRRTYCPYKGEASYWSFTAAGREIEDLCWSYEQPLPGLDAVAGLVAFWDERFDVWLDGERRGRPSGLVAQALRDAFGV